MRAPMVGSQIQVQQRQATLWQQPRRRRQRCRQQLAVHANLLDLFRGGSAPSSSLPRDAGGEALKLWVEARGLPPQKLAAVTVPGAGRGLAATAPIAKGDRLLRIPAPQLLITPALAAQQSCLAPLLEATPLPAWSVLALWLAEARAAGAAGEWWPYISLLPEDTGCVLEWSQEEVGWLAGSQLAEEAGDIRAAADASWAEMQPVLAQAEGRGVGPPGAFTRSALQWAFAILLSRLVRLASLAAPAATAATAGTAAGTAAAAALVEPPGTEALIPFADLLNHSPESTAFLDWSEADAAVVLTADRRYGAGEEVLVSYGQKSGGELLLSYGFCPRPSNNPFDGCKLRLSLPAGDPAFEWKAAALATHGYAPSQLFPLRMAAAPFDLVHYAALAVAKLGSQAETTELAKQLFEQGEIPLQMQQAALELVVAACQAANKAYLRSFDEDRAELDQLEDQAPEATAAGAAAQGAGGVAGEAGEGEAQRQQQEQRRRMVLQCLVYQRQVLTRTAFILQQELKDLKRMARR